MRRSIPRAGTSATGSGGPSTRPPSRPLRGAGESAPAAPGREQGFGGEGCRRGPAPCVGSSGTKRRRTSAAWSAGRGAVPRPPRLAGCRGTTETPRSTTAGCRPRKQRSDVSPVVLRSAWKHSAERAALPAGGKLHPGAERGGCRTRRRPQPGFGGGRTRSDDQDGGARIVSAGGPLRPAPRAPIRGGSCSRAPAPRCSGPCRLRPSRRRSE